MNFYLNLFMAKISREIRNKVYYYVARDEKGRILTSLKQKTSKYDIEQLKEIFKKNKTFNPEIKASRETLKNVALKSSFKQTTLSNRNSSPISRKPKQTAMYNVRGYVKIGGSKSFEISANSMSDSDISAREKKAQAWESFLERLSEVNGGEYDADEGTKYINKVSGLKEGWVYFTRI